MRIQFSVSILALYVLLCLVASVTNAANQPGLSLLRPDSLLGWNASGGDTAWKIEKGRLSGAGDVEPLLAEWMFGDFELNFRWSASKGQGWLLSFPTGLGKSEWSIVLRDQETCGIRTHAQGPPLGKVIDATQEVHTTKVQRKGSSVSLIVDGKLLHVAKVTADRRVGLTLKPSDDSAWLENLRVKEPEGKSLFNGKDLSGWWTPGRKEAWHAEDGQIVKRGGGGNYLRTEEEYGDFTFSMEYKVGKGANSGIGIRTPRDGWPSSDGMELQILDRPGTGSGSNMSIYRNVVPVEAAHRSEEWNRVVIKAEGYMVSAWINGVLVQHFNTYHHPELKYRHLRGWIGLQDHGSVNYYRSLSLLEVPVPTGTTLFDSGSGMPQWLQSRTPRGADLVLDRLMNPKRLSADDGIRSSTTTSSTSGKEQILADLKGPGALVRIARTNNQGRLAFYFDGESKPRIDIPASQLRSLLPVLTDHTEPFLTYVGYRKSLKIVLRDVKKHTEYQIDHLTLPKDVQVPTFVDTQTSIPRGWIETIDYRHHHFKHGQHRQIDPLSRERVQGKTIKPGKAASLVSLPGAGVVHWWKLLCPPQALQNNDLWIDVAVDGEARPALSAPARYLFASVVEGKNHNNFVTLHRGGPTTRLALPFGKGITLSARNTGAKAVSGVGLELSYEKQKKPAGNRRLYGDFHVRSSSVARKITGSGRVIGVVWSQTEGEPFLGLPVRADGASLVGSANDPSRESLFLGSAGQGYEFRRCLSGRGSGLAWRYLWLAPREFEKSLVVDSRAGGPGEMLLLYYRAKP